MLLAEKPSSPSVPQSCAARFWTVVWQSHPAAARRLAIRARFTTVLHNKKCNSMTNGGRSTPFLPPCLRKSRVRRSCYRLTPLPHKWEAIEPPGGTPSVLPKHRRSLTFSPRTTFGTPNLDYSARGDPLLPRCAIRTTGNRVSCCTSTCPMAAGADPEAALHTLHCIPSRSILIQPCPRIDLRFHAQPACVLHCRHELLHTHNGGSLLQRAEQSRSAVK